MIGLAVISVGALCALTLAVLVLGALVRDLVAARRRRRAALAQAELDASAARFRRDFTGWCADEADRIWANRRAA